MIEDTLETIKRLEKASYTRIEAIGIILIEELRLLNDRLKEGFENG